MGNYDLDKFNGPGSTDELLKYRLGVAREELRQAETELKEALKSGDELSIARARNRIEGAKIRIADLGGDIEEAA